MIHYVSGDLFKNKYNLQAMAHGCNIQGVMGAGIAAEFKHRYPDMYKLYKNLCLNRKFKLGDIFVYEDDVYIYNLATQENTSTKRATPKAIENSLYLANKDCLARGVERLGLPRIGAGLGGMEWAEVKQIIEKVFKDSTLEVYVYETYKRNE